VSERRTREQKSDGYNVDKSSVRKQLLKSGKENNVRQEKLFTERYDKQQTDKKEQLRVLKELRAITDKAGFPRENTKHWSFDKLKTEVRQLPRGALSGRIEGRGLRRRKKKSR